MIAMNRSKIQLRIGEPLVVFLSMVGSSFLNRSCYSVGSIHASKLGCIGPSGIQAAYADKILHLFFRCLGLAFLANDCELKK